MWVFYMIRHSTYFNLLWKKANYSTFFKGSVDLKKKQRLSTVTDPEFKKKMVTIKVRI